jgi:hypothetical protein
MVPRNLLSEFLLKPDKTNLLIGVRARSALTRCLANDLEDLFREAHGHSSIYALQQSIDPDRKRVKNNFLTI